MISILGIPSTLLKYPAIFLLSLILTLYCSYIGDDDIVYRAMGRKPTQQEGVARFRYVIVRTIANLSGGACLGILVGVYVIRENLNLEISRHQASYLVLVFIVIAHILIGLIQNLIRASQGRPMRPPIDFKVWRDSATRWSNWFKRRS